MSKKISMIGLVTLLLSTCTVMAGEIGPLSATFSDVYPILSLDTGYANIQGGSSQSYTGDDQTVFLYTNQGQGASTAFVGGFLGVEYARLYDVLFVQAGVEYNYFGSASVNGLNSVGVNPETSTRYNYSYRFHPQQVLVVGKVLTTTHQVIHPYFSLGIGAAFNRIYQYTTSPTTENTNLTPIFSKNQQTNFSCNLGIGIDADIAEHLRFGMGYRFSNFGMASLGNGGIVSGDTSTLVPFTVSTSNAYANQLLFQISYLN